MQSFPWLSASLLAALFLIPPVVAVVLRRGGFQAAKKLASFAFWTTIVVLLIPLAWAGVRQIDAFFRPAWNVLYAEPDPVLGWRLVPDLDHIWTGTSPYAWEYEHVVEINSHGFYDVEREIEKEPGKIRVALLGDSMVEGRQVALKETAAQALERMLNDYDREQGGSGGRFEVLNFGVTGYTSGQTYLLYDQFGKLFEPDLAVVWITRLVFNRTGYSHEGPHFTGADRDLQVIPMFALDDEGSLTWTPPTETPEFQEAVDRRLAAQGGKRAWKRPYSAIRHLKKDALRLKENVRARLYEELVSDGPRGYMPRPFYDRERADVLAVNLAILEALHEAARANGTTLAIADASRWHDRKETRMLTLLRPFAEEIDVDYLPVWAHLLEAARRGPLTRAYDSHFNAAGHQAYAEAIYPWIIEQLKDLEDAQPAEDQSAPETSSDDS